MSARSAVNTTFRSLRIRNYRLFAAGQLFSNTGTWMQRIAQDWLVLALTHSGIALGVVAALQFLPILLLSVWGGALADRYPKRAMLMITQTTMGLLAAALGGLTLGGAVTVWQIYLFALALGTVTALDTPARQSFVVEMVGPRQLQNAVSLNSANFNLARIVGPAVAGVMIGMFSSEITGSGWVFLINAISYTAVVASLAAIRGRDLLPARTLERRRGQQIEGFRYLRTRPDLIAVLATVLIFGTFGLNFPVLLPLFTTGIFYAGASAYGLLSAIMAVGSLIGALLAAQRGTARIRIVLGGAVAFGVLEALSSTMPDFAAFALLLLLTGTAGLTVATTANAVMQTTVAPQLRGRVMGVYLLVFMGGTPIGAPVVGWLATVVGVRWTLAFCGVTTALCAVAAAYLLAWHTDRRILARVTRRPHLAVVPRTA
ncbi:MFS transporter [Actinocrinis puniceicyclus]|uniref:MFS transporter n=1 Tax=Actinocrinis puniceicyclus TaxID=977794 RepID=A0A8J7WMN6_9ACTN|nr:MFS transporter [Actinocrinis puniceicyclus]MBS2962522.1 MFS transporter [Actinocrinis puniceicyclus]